MRKVFLFISVLFCLTSEAQIIRANPYYRPFAVAASNLLLDDYPGAAAAYSLRKLDKDYSGSAIRVRRSSDNTEQDIGFVSGGTELDTTALKSFVGTGGSDNGFVVTWYSQTGSNNVTQATSTAQPTIVEGGVINRRNTKPTIDFGFFGGTARFLGGSYSVAQPNSMFMVGISSGTNDAHFFDATGTRQIIGFTGGNFVIFAGSVLTHVATASAVSFQLMTALFNGASSTIQINNGSTTTGNAGTNTWGSPRVGASNSGSAVPGSISELIVYNSNQSSNESGIKSNINTFYSIY